MQHKKKFLFLLIFIVIIVLPVATDALRLNVGSYPEIGGVDLRCIEVGTCDLSVGIIVVFIYNAAIWIGGIVAFITIVYAGFLFIFSGNAPGNRSKAKGMLTNVIWGISILLLSYVTLILINPDLVKLPESVLTGIQEGDVDFNIGNVENRLFEGAACTLPMFGGVPCEDPFGCIDGECKMPETLPEGAECTLPAFGGVPCEDPFGCIDGECKMP